MAGVAGGDPTGNKKGGAGREVDTDKIDSFGVTTNAPRPGNAPSVAFLMNRKYNVDSQLGDRAALSEIANSLLFPTAQWDEVSRT